jgi:gliding motility-associated-like protein
MKKLILIFIFLYASQVYSKAFDCLATIPYHAWHHSKIDSNLTNKEFYITLINNLEDVEAIKFQPNAKIYIFDHFEKMVSLILPEQGEGWNGLYLEKTAPEQNYWFISEILNRFENQSLEEDILA